MAYHFHVRKNKGLSLSGLLLLLPAFARKAHGENWSIYVPDRHCRRTDHFPCCYRSNFTRGLSALTGLPDNFTVQAL